MPGDILPAIAVQLMQVEQPLLLIVVPRLLVDRRVEVIIPSLSALLARADGNRIGLFQLLRDLGPIVESKLSHKTTDGLVLLTKQTATSQLQDCRFISISYKIYIYYLHTATLQISISITTGTAEIVPSIRSGCAPRSTGLTCFRCSAAPPKISILYRLGILRRRPPGKDRRLG